MQKYMMKYKGYCGKATYDDEANIFHGEVIGLKDIIPFQGEDVRSLKKAFQDSIDDYLLMITIPLKKNGLSYEALAKYDEERGEQPEKTYSGNLRIRMNPTLHAHLAIEAAKQGLSLNDLINEKLRR